MTKTKTKTMKGTQCTCRACWNARKHAKKHYDINGWDIVPEYVVCQGHSAIQSVAHICPEVDNGANLYRAYDERRQPIPLAGTRFGPWVVISSSDSIFPFPEGRGKDEWGVTLVRVAQVKDGEYRIRKLAVLAHRFVAGKFEYILEFHPGTVDAVAVAIALDAGIDTCVYGGAIAPEEGYEEYRGRQTCPACSTK